MDFKKYLFPKTFQEKQKSMEQGLFVTMGINFLTGVALFFVLTGYRLKLILNRPVFFLVTAMLMLGMFYFSFLCRKVAIATREFTTFEELRMIFIFFVKRFCQLIIFPYLILVIHIFKQGDLPLTFLLLAIASFALLLLFFTERKLIFRQWSGDCLN